MAGSQTKRKGMAFSQRHLGRKHPFLPSRFYMLSITAITAPFGRIPYRTWFCCVRNGEDPTIFDIFSRKENRQTNESKQARVPGATTIGTAPQMEMRSRWGSIFMARARIRHLRHFPSITHVFSFFQLPFSHPSHHFSQLLQCSAFGF